MNILLLGSGGREHALAWAILQNPKCDRLIVAPGNAGIATIAPCHAIDPCDASAVLNLVAQENITFVVIGPEAPLAVGVSDALRNVGILTFGPSQFAAQLESSKAFTKEICDACAAPTAAWARFTAPEPARAYVQSQGAPIVVKADGLAAGKGVVVAMTQSEALSAIDAIFAEFSNGALIIEDFMTGEEASFFVLTDGVNALPIGTAQDHKRAFDGDHGPNTGGMGAYSPAPVLTDEIQNIALNTIVIPTLKEMARRGTPYQGVLYAGLMIENGQPRLVEYNARFGDPEAQVLCMRLGGQMLDLLLACAQGDISQSRVNWADDHALTIVMAANGYPGRYARGEAITLPEITDPKVQIFHAGTARKDANLTSNGGRVLNITARGDTLQAAHKRAYETIAKINWPGGFYRKDIGWRAL